MAVFDGLKSAIVDLLKSAETKSNRDEVMVSKRALYVLQEEYNIHFVEPEDVQVKFVGPCYHEEEE